MDIENFVKQAQQKEVAEKRAEMERQISPRARILNEAMKITHHDRNANYGNPEDNFQHIANLWNAYLRVTRPMAAVINSADVAVMSMLIKVARLGNNPGHRDSAVDIAGYAACLGDIQEKLAGTAIQGTPRVSVTAAVDQFMQQHARNHESSSNG